MAAQPLVNLSWLAKSYPLHPQKPILPIKPSDLPSIGEGKGEVSDNTTGNNMKYVNLIKPILKQGKGKPILQQGKKPTPEPISIKLVVYNNGVLIITWIEDECC